VTDKEIHAKLAPYKRNKAICSNCKEHHQTGYHSTKYIVVEDLRLLEKRVFLQIPKRYYRCPKADKKIFVEEISEIKYYSRITRRFGKQVSRLTAITTNQEAGWYLGLDDEKVYRIDKSILEEEAKKN